MVPDASRHRLLANGWHMGVAKFVLSAVIGHVLQITPAHASSPPPSPRSTSLQWTITTWLKFVEDRHFQLDEFLNIFT
eukprot:5155494-Amphidinium_carterae.1